METMTSQLIELNRLSSAGYFNPDDFYSIAFTPFGIDFQGNYSDGLIEKYKALGFIFKHSQNNKKHYRGECDQFKNIRIIIL